MNYIHLKIYLKRILFGLAAGLAVLANTHTTQQPVQTTQKQQLTQEQLQLIQTYTNIIVSKLTPEAQNLWKTLGQDKIKNLVIGSINSNRPAEEAAQEFNQLAQVQNSYIISTGYADPAIVNNTDLQEFKETSLYETLSKQPKGTPIYLGYYNNYQSGGKLFINTVELKNWNDNYNGTQLYTYTYNNTKENITTIFTGHAFAGNGTKALFVTNSPTPTLLVDKEKLAITTTWSKPYNSGIWSTIKSYGARLTPFIPGLFTTIGSLFGITGYMGGAALGVLAGPYCSNNNNVQEHGAFITLLQNSLQDPNYPSLTIENNTDWQNTPLFDAACGKTNILSIVSTGALSTQKAPFNLIYHYSGQKIFNNSFDGYWAEGTFEPTAPELKSMVGALNFKGYAYQPKNNPTKAIFMGFAQITDENKQSQIIPTLQEIPIDQLTQITPTQELLNIFAQIFPQPQAPQKDPQQTSTTVTTLSTIQPPTGKNPVAQQPVAQQPVAPEKHIESKLQDIKNIRHYAPMLYRNAHYHYGKSTRMNGYIRKHRIAYLKALAQQRYAKKEYLYNNA